MSIEWMVVEVVCGGALMVVEVVSGGALSDLYREALAVEF